MASTTRYYGLGFFDFGDPLGTDFAGQIEVDRWVFVDKQLYGLMSIFGNGVIEGWEVTADTAFSISISEGFGNINFMAGRSEFPTPIADIPPNSVNYVFARIKERTRFAEDVEFILAPTRTLDDPRFLLLAEIVSGPLSIERIDNSVRQEITFLELIKAAIRAHKHRGGSQNPSKIDLTSEVKGQLPAFRIADFDAEKITTGTFDLSRMPLIDHQDLANVGLLTHPQLDTFVKTIEVSNKEIFGEVSTANLLQLILAAKLIYDDPASSFYISDRTFDQNMINEIAIIPGITPDNLIDFDSTTATINLEQHYIEGVAPTTGTSFYVNYDTNLAWNSAFSRENVIVVGNSVSLAFNEDDETNIVTIEGFESATAPNQLLSGTDDGGLELFRRETVITTDNAKITANGVATDVIEGFYSGKFKHQQSFRVQYKKEFSTAQDWSTYDSFALHIKCLSSIHGAVKIFFYDSNNEKSPEFVILDEDEITQNDDPAENNFELRVVSTSQISFKDDVKGFVILSDDTENPFHFFIDFINIQRAVLLPESGTLVLRYSTSNTVTFSQIEWSSIEPAGTEIRVRARAASGTVFLSRADFTPFLNSGDLLNLSGTDLEIEIEFFPDGDRLQSPVLESLRVLVLTEAEVDGFVLDSVDEFSRGDSLNITLNTDTASLSLGTPIYVDSYYFCLGNSVNQIHEETNDSGDNFVQGELAIFGNDAPIAPNQIFAAVEAGDNRVTLSRFFEPRSVVRRNGRTFVVADTFNDRVLEYDEDGVLLTGVGSINYEHASKVFPIAAAYDVRTGILYLVWSKRINFSTVDVDKITIQSTTRQVQLIENFDKIMGLTTAELEEVNAEGQIMPIHLSLQNSGLVEQLGTGAYILVSDDALSTGMNADSVFYTTISTALGIPIYIGNFAYIDGIFCPTYANKTEKEHWLITNATVGVVEYDFPETLEDDSITKSTTASPIVEIDENNIVVFASDKVEFSPFIPGKAEYLDDNMILIGGIKPGGELGTPEENQFNFRAISGDDAEKLRRKDVLNTLFFGSESSPKEGAVIVLDRRSGATTFEFVSAEGLLVSDVDVDPTDGLYVVAESSFKKSGRVIKIDASGNIVFSFGEGLYGVINDIVVQFDGSFVVST